jgi:hypothetical protein
MRHEQNFINSFLNCKSTGMNITDYVVMIFKHEIIILVPWYFVNALMMTS